MATSGLVPARRISRRHHVAGGLPSAVDAINGSNVIGFTVLIALVDGAACLRRDVLTLSAKPKLEGEYSNKLN